MPDKIENKLYLEITTGTEPSEIDPDGCDGLYVLEVKVISSKWMKDVLNWLDQMNKHWVWDEDIDETYSANSDGLVLVYA